MYKHLLVGIAAAALAACETDNASNTGYRDTTTTTTTRQGDTGTRGTRPMDTSQQRQNQTYPQQQGGMTQQGMSQQTDATFAQQAALSGLAEIELGRLAQQRASSDAVRQFADHIVNDHTRANADLKQLARNQGITLPADLDQQHRQLLDTLSRQRGQDFDRQFVQQMIDDHQQAVNLFDTEARTGQNSELRAWAAHTVPVLRDHLRMAQDLQNQINMGGAGGTNQPGINQPQFNQPGMNRPDTPPHGDTMPSGDANRPGGGSGAPR